MNLTPNVEANAPISRVKEITNAIDRAMRSIKGKESEGGLPHFNDNIVDFGLFVELTFPQYKETLDTYKKWIVKNDMYLPGYPYWNIRHVMSLGSLGEDKKAVDIFSRLKPLSNNGKWGTSYHVGFYLYGCIVANETELLDKTLKYLAETVEQEPNQFHYFTALCVWKAYERTKDEKYKELFLSIVKSLKPFKEAYVDMAATDGHMGETLCVFCMAYALTRDEEYRELCEGLVDALLTPQISGESWNDFAAYAIMPAAGLTLYLNIL